MRDAITKFVLSMIIGCIIFGIAFATMHATRVAPADSFIEIFWGLTTAALWILSFGVIFAGISNLLNDI